MRTNSARKLMKTCALLLVLTLTTSSLALTTANYAGAKYISKLSDSAVFYVVEAKATEKYSYKGHANSGHDPATFFAVTLQKGWWYFCLRGGNGRETKNDSVGGLAGYSEGMYYFNKQTTVYVNVATGGGSGNNSASYAGGRGGPSSGGAGGGATIAYMDPGSGFTPPTSYNNSQWNTWYTYMNNNRGNFLGVAGGGGGAGDQNNAANWTSAGGNAGSLENGSTGTTANGSPGGVGNPSNPKGGGAGTGTSGGAAGDGDASAGQFLWGGNAASNYYAAGGGGAGWYGGGGGSWPTSGRDGGGGGGSSYRNPDARTAPTTGAYTYIGTLQTANKVNSRDGFAIFAYLGDFNDGTPTAAAAYFPPAGQQF